jgi:hypothetical protein
MYSSGTMYSTGTVDMYVQQWHYMYMQQWHYV